MRYDFDEFQCDSNFETDNLPARPLPSIDEIEMRIAEKHYSYDRLSFKLAKALRKLMELHYIGFEV